ncbi:DUF1295 domain-containing protein [Mobilitalea sibirica]|nr:DUF1295 domain-containing protein [Mobilitalea sibirica]
MIHTMLFIFAYFLLFFIIGTIRKNNSIVDIGWGLGFVAVAWDILLITDEIKLSQWLIVLCVSTWGLRLFIHIYKRNKGKPEDFRYAAWRREWGKWLIPRSFFQIYMLQAFFMFIIALPIIFTRYINDEVQLGILIIGFLIWITGFCFEVVSDNQLRVFLKKQENRGKLMMDGLWRFTRHPNYFGEATLWWGIYLMALSLGVPVLTIISPITITVLLVFVSGIPLLENSMKNKPEYQEYAEKTSIFIPWFPKK